MEPTGKRGNGAFQWNRGGWFGSQLGATLWLLILGMAVLARHEPVGVALLAAGLLPNLVGTALWLRRRTLSPYPAIQILLAVSGLSAWLAVVAVTLMGLSPSEVALPPAVLFVIYPALMLTFHWRERAARRAGA